METLFGLMGFCLLMYGLWWVIGLFPWVIITICFVAFCFGIKGLASRYEAAEFWAPPMIIISILVAIAAGVHMIWFPV